MAWVATVNKINIIIIITRSGSAITRGTITSKATRWSESQHWGVWVTRTAEGCTGDGAEWGSPFPKVGPCCRPRKKFWKFAFKILPFCAVSAKKLASVCEQYGTVKREQNWCCITKWNDDELSAGAQARGTRVDSRGTGPVWPALGAAMMTRSLVFPSLI